MTEEAEKAARMLDEGRLDEACALLDDAADTAEVCLLRARILMEQRRMADAEACLRQALTDFPGEEAVYRQLAGLLAQDSRLQEAVQVFEQGVRVMPERPFGYQGLGECLLASGEQRRAAEFLVYAWQLDRTDYRLAGETGKLLLQLGDHRNASVLLRAAHEGDPDNPLYAFLYAETCFYQDDVNRALALYQSVTTGEYAVIAGARQVACLTAQNRIDEALKRVDELLADGGAGHQQQLLGAKAELALIAGDAEGAARIARQCVSGPGTPPGAWQVLQQAGALTDADVSAMSAQHAGASGDIRMELGFYLAAECEKRGDYAAELQLLHDSNALKAERVTYRPDQQAAYLSAVRDAFPVASPDAAAEPRLPLQIKPLLIIGMPRSGTTLLEQIVSSHSQVAAGGESYAFRAACDAAASELGLAHYQALWQQPSASYCHLLREQYQRFHVDGGVALPHVTDKAITLYRYLGAFHQAFPEAAIVVMHRHPLDLALGQYKQLFATGQHFTYRPEWIADALAGFYRQMRHWDSLGIPMLHLRYEDMVASQESTTRKVLAQCGLPWESACLDFHRNSRTVATASVTQVRQGLFAGAANRWARYGALLDPFREAMQAVGIDVDAYSEAPFTLFEAQDGGRR